MPTNMRTAAVEHRVRRGNGAVLVTGVKMAQQLEKATTNYYCIRKQWFGNHNNPCHYHFLKLAPQHCLSRVRSLLRLRGAAGRPGRNRRLRAQTETRSQMPILRPVNSWGTQLSRNTTNSGIDRFDGQRAFLRRTVREVRNKEAVLCPDGTRHRCPLGSITSFASLEATVTQRLRIPDLSLPVRGLPLNKKTRQNTLRSGTDGNGTPGRAACWTAGEHARVALGTPAAADRWTLGGWLVASATTGNCIRDGDFTSDVHERRVKDARTGHVK
jgi:hypothetical protein